MRTREASIQHPHQHTVVLTPHAPEQLSSAVATLVSSGSVIKSHRRRLTSSARTVVWASSLVRRTVCGEGDWQISADAWPSTWPNCVPEQRMMPVLR